MNEDVTVHKLDLTGEEKISYPGRVLARDARSIVIEAFFGRERMELGYVTLKPGDRFVEYFYGDRWYNVFVIYDVDGGALKGWYCNIIRPAEMTAEHVRAVDLALDYFVQPSGREFILDEDEFNALPLSPDERNAARAALGELQRMAAQHMGPFALSPK
ncbi:MAG: DUF402 domain-containing protein [Anaerolineales bacterium]